MGCSITFPPLPVTCDGCDHVPFIGENGNWHVGDTDTGVQAQGTAGPQGPEGPQGEPGPQGIPGKDAANLDMTPVGTVISFMGARAPDNYLICDGTVYNISSYQALADHIRDSFGTCHYFGGNGTTTFAVPDLRNEFLRGYHGAAAGLSGIVGKNQPATLVPNIVANSDVDLYVQVISDTGKCVFVRNPDSFCTMDNTQPSPRKAMAMQKKSLFNNYVEDGDKQYYSVRPTNVAVLFCIKYK